MKRWVLVSLGHGRRQRESTEFQRGQEAEAHLAAARGGIEARIAVAEGDPNLQIQQILEAVAGPPSSRPAAVVICTVTMVGFERVARTALAAGVGWVLIDNPRPVDVLRAEFPDQLVSWASVDYVDAGRLSGRIAAGLLPQGGKLLTVEGPSTTAPALQRRRGLEQVIRGSKLRIADTLVADWKPTGARKAAEAWLESAGPAAQRPDLVVSQNDEMAEAVLHTIGARRPAWGKVPAIGCDGLPDCGQRLVREGVLAATVVNPPATGPGVELVARWLKGEPVKPVTIPLRPLPAVEDLAPVRSVA